MAATPSRVANLNHATWTGLKRFWVRLLVDEGGIQKAYLLSTNPDEQDQQDDDEGNPVSQDQDDEPDQDRDDDGKDLAARNQGQAKAAKVPGAKAKTSIAEKGDVKLELISGRPEAWQALKPGPATLSVMVEEKPQLGDSDWLEIRLLRVKRRG